MKYEVIIFWSAADDAFLAEIPELPGCMADGKTHQAALKAVRRVAREWIETGAAARAADPAAAGPTDVCLTGRVSDLSEPRP